MRIIKRPPLFFTLRLILHNAIECAILFEVLHKGAHNGVFMAPKTNSMVRRKPVINLPFAKTIEVVAVAAPQSASLDVSVDLRTAAVVGMTANRWVEAVRLKTAGLFHLHRWMDDIATASPTVIHGVIIVVGFLKTLLIIVGTKLELRMLEAVVLISEKLTCCRQIRTIFRRIGRVVFAGGRNIQSLIGSVKNLLLVRIAGISDVLSIWLLDTLKSEGEVVVMAIPHVSFYLVIAVLE